LPWRYGGFAGSKSGTSKKTGSDTSTMFGVNGAGKTTLLRHVLGLLKAQSGSVRVFGHEPVRGCWWRWLGIGIGVEKPVKLVERGYRTVRLDHIE